MTSAPERVPRLLALLPWLVANPGVGVADAASHFAVSERELLADITLLTMTGPGQYGGDLVDVQIDVSDQIYVQDPQSLARPLRLTTDEATALLVGLRLLGQVPGIIDRAALVSAEAKLNEAVLERSDPKVIVSVSAVDEAVGHAVESALASGHVLHLTYLGATRDEITKRKVDPLRLLVLEGRSYLEGWCHSAAAVRTFRLDRILAAEILAEVAAPPSAAGPEPIAGRLAPEGELVTFALLPAGTWVLEQIPYEALEPGPGGTQVVTLRATEDVWVLRLALALGGDGTLLAPQRIIQLVQSAANVALSNYHN